MARRDDKPAGADARPPATAPDAREVRGGAEAPGSRPGWIPKTGERAITIGQTGSGKTTFQCWLLQRTENSPVVIYDTKEEPKFEDLPASRVVTSLRGVRDAADDGEIDFVVFRPPVETLADPAALDDLLMHHYHQLRGVDAYIDELYSFHEGGRAGPGLVALYTRGRSRGITTLASTQRPAWISRFSMSEAQIFYVFHLNDADDRKIVSRASGMPVMPNPPKHHFYVFRAGEEKARLVKPIQLEGNQSYGYVDPVISAVPDADSAEAPEQPATPHLWL